MPVFNAGGAIRPLFFCGGQAWPGGRWAGRHVHEPHQALSVSGSSPDRESVRGPGPSPWPRWCCPRQKTPSAGSGAAAVRRLPCPEAQRHAVVAVALAGGPGTVVEDMTLMTAATTAVIFGAGNQQTEVLAGCDGVGQGLPKTGPASATVEFGCGGKQRQLAAAAQILTGALLLVEGTAEGSLSAMLAQHLKSGWGQSLFPSGFTELPLGIAAGWRCCLGTAGASPNKSK